MERRKEELKDVLMALEEEAKQVITAQEELRVSLRVEKVNVRSVLHFSPSTCHYYRVIRCIFCKIIDCSE